MVNYQKVFLSVALVFCLGFNPDRVNADEDSFQVLGSEGCTYIEADVQYEQGKMATGSHHIDSCILSSGKMVDIEGLTNEIKMSKLNGRTSGRTILTIPGATIKDGVLKVPPKATIGTKTIRSFSNGRYLSEEHRALASGTKSVFVLRANALDASTTSDVTTISDEIFGTGTDVVNLKSQYAACSYNELNFEPFIGTTSSGQSITAGVGEVDININVAGVDNSVVRQAMVDAGNTKYGNLESQFDHVMLCLPGGTSGSWIAYAYINSWLSVYNDNWCNYPSGQMHELGHNLGLAHSGETATYDDQSGMMGYSYSQDEGPVMCFNTPKNWQLGWYSDARYSFSPLTTSFSGRLIGLSDYDLFDPITSTEKVMIQMTGIDASNDYYVSFNRKSGVNSGTVEGGNQVLVHRRVAGTGYEVSTLLTKLNAGESYTTSDVTVRVNTIDIASSPAYADITITGPTSAPTNAPTPVPTTFPTLAPTDPPTPPVTPMPTTLPPTNEPTDSPTPLVTTSLPTNEPTDSPTPLVTPMLTTSPPTNEPTDPPTPPVTPMPTTSPPTNEPTDSPTPLVTTSPPTNEPTDSPTPLVTPMPTTSPPTNEPTDPPTLPVTPIPTTSPPTNEPTDSPTPLVTTSPPTNEPTDPPTLPVTPMPTTSSPTFPPTNTPTFMTEVPTHYPTNAPVSPPTTCALKGKSCDKHGDCCNPSRNCHPRKKICKK